MKEDRRAIIGGGVAILRALFDLLRIDEMQAATGGLRHGLLCDLIGNTGDEQDVRSLSVQRLAAKFNVDTAHGERVGKVAIALFEQTQAATPVQSDTGQERNTRTLGWAARLHEIGAQISHSDHHIHGAYILDNADAMGFSLAELHRLSLLVLGHRGKLRKLKADFDDAIFVRQLLALRLAIIFCHARREPDTAGLRLSRNADQSLGFALTSRPGWVAAYPQSAHLLREEALAWQKTPWSFTFNGA